MNGTRGFRVTHEKQREERCCCGSEESLDFWLRRGFDSHFWPARIQVEKGTDDFRPKPFFPGIMWAELRNRSLLVLNSAQL